MSPFDEVPMLPDGEPDNDLEFILSCCPNLQQMRHLDSDWDEGYAYYHFGRRDLSALSQTCGHKLLDLRLRIHERDSMYDPVALSGFTSLRHLDWSSDVRFNMDHTNLSKTAFCNLETMTCIPANDTFLRLMTLQE